MNFERMKIFKWGENKKNQIEVIEFHLIVTFVRSMIAIRTFWRSCNRRVKKQTKLGSNNLKNIKHQLATKSGHKLKLRIKQYIPKQLLASKVA